MWDLGGTWDEKYCSRPLVLPDHLPCIQPLGGRCRVYLGDDSWPRRDTQSLPKRSWESTGLVLPEGHRERAEGRERPWDVYGWHILHHRHLTRVGRGKARCSSPLMCDKRPLLHLAIPEVRRWLKCPGTGNHCVSWSRGRGWSPVIDLFLNNFIEMQIH